ncbi:MAG TPA: hypothetical protein VK892_19245, partial [Pyrinomonadaceae bacterium]|nr:hypothetical protein [Pyrinomonadaceae bacterium]
FEKWFPHQIARIVCSAGYFHEGFEIKAEDLKALSPYLTKHIKRFGDYVVDMSQIPPPLEIEYTFSLER